MMVRDDRADAFAYMLAAINRVPKIWRWKYLRGGGIEVGLWIGEPVFSFTNSADGGGGQAVICLGFLTVRFSYNSGKMFSQPTLSENREP